MLAFDQVHLDEDGVSQFFRSYCGYTGALIHIMGDPFIKVKASKESYFLLNVLI